MSCLGHSRSRIFNEVQSQGAKREIVGQHLKRSPSRVTHPLRVPWWVSQLYQSVTWNGTLQVSLKEAAPVFDPESTQAEITHTSMKAPLLSLLNKVLGQCNTSLYGTMTKGFSWMQVRGCG